MSANSGAMALVFLLAWASQQCRHVRRRNSSKRKSPGPNRRL
jgi:hypothetical protein